VVRLKFERRWSAHSKMFITLFALCVCSLSVFTQEFGDRIENLLTILLTIVAYQYVIETEIPKIAHQTKADFYVLMCFLFVTLIVAETAVLSEIDMHLENAHEWDFLAMVAVSSLFAVANVAFLAVVCVAQGREMKKLRWYRQDYHQENDDDDDDTSVSHREFRVDKKIKNVLSAFWEASEANPKDPQ